MKIEKLVFSITNGLKIRSADIMLLSNHNLSTTAEIVNRALESKNKRLQASAQKTISDKETDLAIDALMLNPGGISIRELLIAAECESVISIVARVRNRLKKEGKYVLSRKKRQKEIIYFLENKKH